MNLLNLAVLQLNASFEPTDIISARKAIKLLVKEKAEIIHSRDRQVHPGLMLPSVIRLLHFRHIPHRKQVLSRKHIYVRDRHRCQYCGKKFSPQDLTLDHILPQSRGGQATWQNLVACCRPDNRRKADRTPEEAGMVLLNRPRAVNVHTSRHLLRSLGEDEVGWRKYLYFENLTPQESLGA